MTKEELWQAALAEIELHVSRASFLTWFRNTAISSRKDSGVIINVPSTFAREWLENKFNKIILRALRGLSPDVKEISFIIEVKKQTGVKAPHASFRVSTANDQLRFEQLQIDKTTNLNPKYTFTNFIVGSSNELAHAAALSVAENLGREYNPLFIYGGVGLGKTHLIQAVGNTVKERGDQKIQYVSCEKFTNEFIHAVQNQRLKDFRENYRKVDLLIIDDIQFIARKERTQEEFFHTFNTLYDANKQIVLSSDRPPKSLDFLDERLRSRFEGGMIADIGYPDYEMRRAILNEKLRERAATLSEPIMQYLAEHIQNNIRELEGAINVLLTSSKMDRAELSIEKVKKLLAHIIKRPKRMIGLKKILKIVADFYDISEKELLSKNRRREIALPRQIVMYIMREEFKQSYPIIGSRIGGRDHTTVIHACSKIEEQLKNNNEQLAEELQLIKQEIYSC